MSPSDRSAGRPVSRITELDGLRALAVLLVIGCHYGGFVQASHGLLEFGWIGVDIFFVLSGYLITSILLGLRHRESPYATFYARRAVRILPPYVLAVVSISAIGFLTHRPFKLYAHYYLKQLLFLQAYQQGSAAWLRHEISHPVQLLHALPPLLLHANALPANTTLLTILLSATSPFWSLSIEEYFYVLWAPVMLHLSRRAVLVTACLLCVLEPLLRWADGTSTAYFNLFFRFDTLLYGAFLAFLLHANTRRRLPWLGRAFALTGVAALGSLAVIVATAYPLLGHDVRALPLANTLGVPLFAIAAACVIGLLVLHAGEHWWPGRLLRTAPLQFIGTISYTLYLFHVLVLVIVTWMFHRLRLSATPLLLQDLLALALALGVSRASWHFIEKPLLRWKDRRFPSAPHPPPPELT